MTLVFMFLQGAELPNANRLRICKHVPVTERCTTMQLNRRLDLPGYTPGFAQQSKLSAGSPDRRQTRVYCSPRSCCCFQSAPGPAIAVRRSPGARLVRQPHRSTRQLSGIQRTQSQLVGSFHRVHRFPHRLPNFSLIK